VLTGRLQGSVKWKISSCPNQTIIVEGTAICLPKEATSCTMKPESKRERRDELWSAIGAAVWSLWINVVPRRQLRLRVDNAQMLGSRSTSSPLRRRSKVKQAKFDKSEAKVVRWRRVLFASLFALGVAPFALRCEW
jgi:hypothetical protein